MSSGGQESLNFVGWRLPLSSSAGSFSYASLSGFVYIFPHAFMPEIKGLYQVPEGQAKERGLPLASDAWWMFCICLLNELVHREQGMMPALTVAVILEALYSQSRALSSLSFSRVYNSACHLKGCQSTGEQMDAGCMYSGDQRFFLLWFIFSFSISVFA